MTLHEACVYLVADVVLLVGIAVFEDFEAVMAEQIPCVLVASAEVVVHVIVKGGSVLAHLFVFGNSEKERHPYKKY